MRAIAFMNQKGGVGKTTCTVNLAAALAAEGRRVLLVDIDPQANASIHLAIEVQRLERTRGQLEDTQLSLESLIAEERGTDLARTATDYQKNQLILQATYAITARVLSLSLLDFLR